MKRDPQDYGCMLIFGLFILLLFYSAVGMPMLYICGVWVGFVALLMIIDAIVTCVCAKRGVPIEKSDE